MKQFFEECLKNLEAITGLRQLAYWEMEAAKDQISAQKKLETCIKGMLTVSSQFPDIDEDRQKKVVQKMMIEDTTFESLNSRTVYKWLYQERMQTRPVSQFSEDDLTPTPAFEELPKETQELVNEWKNNVLGQIGKSVPEATAEELEATKGRIKDPYLEKMREDWRRDIPPVKIFNVQGVEIEARTIEEANIAHRIIFERWEKEGNGVSFEIWIKQTEI